MVFSTVLVSLLLLPTVISQMISVDPSMPPKVGDPVTMSCTDSLTTADTHVWSFSQQMGEAFTNLTTDFALSSTSTNGNLNTSWTRNMFSLPIAGTYKCESLLNGSLVGSNILVLISRIIYKGNYNVETYNSEASFDVMCRFQSAPPGLSLTASWCYQPYTYPYLDTSSCNAIPNNSEVLPIIPTQSLTSSNIYTSIVRITNVTIANAGAYRCSLSDGSYNYTKDVRVRVREHIEFLWPAIGIMVQLVIIALFIIMNYTWDSYKDRQKKIERDKKENQNIVATSPIETPLDDEGQSSQHLIKVVPT